MSKLKKIIFPALVLVVLGASLVLGINYYVLFSQSNNIMSVNDVASVGDIEYIMVLGCGVNDGEPSDMLEDRLLMALEVAEKFPDAKLIVSGNNAGPEYDEVGVMKKFCISKGFDEKKIITDDYGFSTGASVTNMKKVYGVEKTVIVTQRYHLYRALHIASQYDIEAYGVASNQRRYANQIYYSFREVLARNKDFAKYMFV